MDCWMHRVGDLGKLDLYSQQLSCPWFTLVAALSFFFSLWIIHRDFFFFKLIFPLSYEVFPYYITLVFLILWFRPGRFSLSKWCSATALSVTVLRGSVPWFWQPVSAPLTHSLSPSVSFDPFTSPFLRAHCDAHVLQSEWPSEYVSSVPTSHLLIACLYTHTAPDD